MCFTERIAASLLSNWVTVTGEGSCVEDEEPILAPSIARNAARCSWITTRALADWLCNRGTRDDLARNVDMLLTLLRADVDRDHMRPEWTSLGGVMRLEPIHPNVLLKRASFGEMYCCIVPVITHYMDLCTHSSNVCTFSFPSA